MKAKLRFLTNIYNPEQPDAKILLTRHFDETVDGAWQQHLRWLKGKIIGDPQATDDYTVEELKSLDMVGVYVLEEDQ